jgi:RimJ/RimL family protein N-acetyltransferase
MKLVTDKPGEYPTVWEWMNRKTRLPWSTDLRTIGTMREDGTIAAAVGFNAWTFSGCWMHVAFDTPHAMNRKIIRAAFEYPFIQCGMEAVYGLTPKGNDEALRMNEKLGFRKIAETIDCVMFEMTADECRWLKEKEYGRQRISTSST